MPKPYPNEFREDVVRVACNREPGVTLEQIAADVGVHPITLSKSPAGRSTSSPTR
ncbi:transposase [Streptomyces clavifer]|uniref:transposase n=1 Tax=Streptomyces clavifer TaxID=68188 RepID=UPI003667C971